ncbi:MAG: hypothetical protein IT440_07625 [Phycisphaeraceae bacterium]|nr:hypothetical protein [Phycisphaeraceae bacterium]
MNGLNRQRELDRILDLYGPDQPVKAMELLERQFTILHNRAQVVLGLCGIVITTTGFSGRLVAGTSVLAQSLIVGGVGLSLLAGIVVVRGVLHLRWLTQQPGDEPRQWLAEALAYRDRKTSCYRAGLLILLAGMALYVVAMALMLLHPQ